MRLRKLTAWVYPPWKYREGVADACALVATSAGPRTGSDQRVYVHCPTCISFTGRKKRTGRRQAAHRTRRGAEKNPKQATGVVSSLEGSQTRRCAEAAPHAQRLKHCAVSMNLAASMPTTLTVSSAGTFPRRVVVQRASNVSQPGKRLAAAGAGRAEGSSKKRDQTRPHTSRTACGEAAIARGFPGTSPCGGTHVV